MKFRILILGAVLVFLSVSLFASAEPVYINDNTVLNSAYISGNSTLGAFVVNASNITVNLAGSTLTRNLTGYDGSTIFSSNGFQNVTLKDGMLNWTDFGVVRPVNWFIDNESNTSMTAPLGAFSGLRFSVINGLNTSIKLLTIYAEGQCTTIVWRSFSGAVFVPPGNSTGSQVVNYIDSDPRYSIFDFQCSGDTSTGNPYNFFVNITYNDSTNIQSIAGNVTGKFAPHLAYDKPTLVNDFLLTNSNLNLINVTYSGSKFFWTNFSDSASNLSVGWYLDVQVNDSGNNPVANANVIATDKNGLVTSGATDSNGRIRLSLPEYVQNSTSKDWKSNYSVTATFGILTDTKSVNLTENKLIYFTLNNSKPIVNLISINDLSNNSYIADSTPDIRFNSTDAEQTTANCTILINGTAGFGENSSVSVNTTTTITVNQMLGDRLYNVSVRCYDGISYGYSTTWWFTVDTTPPAWSNATTNATINDVTAVYKNNFVNFTANWTDANLYGYIFSINQTGTWINYSFINFSANNISNYTIQITASGKTVVYWRFYAQDLAGNWNSTDMQNFTVIPTIEIFINRSSWDLGLVQKNSTTTINSAINVTNLGDINESFMLRILIQDNQSEWNSSESENGAGNNTYVMSGIFVNSSIIPSAGFFNEGDSEDVITTTNKTANSTVFSYSGSSTGGYSVIPGSSAFLWLRFDSPTNISGQYAKYSHAITIQIIAVEA